MNAKSQIFRGEVVHQRLSPRPHTFRYPMTFFGFLIEDLPHLADRVACFKYNQPGLLRINDTDYLTPGDTPIGTKLEALLGPPSPDERTLLISSPRYLGYAFNPVNFHLRLRGESIVAAVAEVNNTFGDRHAYLLKNLKPGANKYTWTARCPKHFHVSPFNSLSGEYVFTLRLDPQQIHLCVDLHRDGYCVMKTWIRGRASELSDRNILRYALLHPLDTALNSMPRILWQAALLYFKKKMPVYRRPTPNSPNTLIDRDRTDRNDGVVV